MRLAFKVPDKEINGIGWNLKKDINIKTPFSQTYKKNSTQPKK